MGPVVEGTVVPNGTKIPGTNYQLNPIRGAFNIGTMIRWLDFNDCWLAAEQGHPSDNLGAILVVADHLMRQGQIFTVKDILEGTIKAYEIQGGLALLNSYNRSGLDHVVLVKVASTAVVSKMLGHCMTKPLTPFPKPRLADNRCAHTATPPTPVPANHGPQAMHAPGLALKNMALRVVTVGICAQLSGPTHGSRKRWGSTPHYLPSSGSHSRLRAALENLALRVATVDICAQLSGPTHGSRSRWDSTPHYHPAAHIHVWLLILRSPRSSQEPGLESRHRRHLHTALRTHARLSKPLGLRTSLPSSGSHPRMALKTQFHGAVMKRLKPGIQAINRVLSGTIAACGDVNSHKNTCLKYTIDYIGLEVFKAEVKKRTGFTFAPARPYVGTFRVACTQRVIISDVPDDQVPVIESYWQILPWPSRKGMPWTDCQVNISEISQLVQDALQPPLTQHFPFNSNTAQITPIFSAQTAASIFQTLTRASTLNVIQVISSTSRFRPPLLLFSCHQFLGPIFLTDGQ
ncbi:hypothetical protein M422DRAFT_264258 [Sphaerobolus stellatus SS14]|uniref:MmgE/PrpD N-terminal domain-containing protein n=1 Tax=Sphaerobolus stellatus (strain SS14) TaxID=990650 RepID=A0A0C9V8Z5_SPHS4|nr:hypothetical protein M422DRAFT_264258 [Sphaerobolus stellatus SS14]